MVEPQLVDYIKKAKAAEQSDEQTRALLYKNGWIEAEVSEAFASLSQPQAGVQAQPQSAQMVQQQPQPQAQPSQQYPKGIPQQSQAQQQPRQPQVSGRPDVRVEPQQTPNQPQAQQVQAQPRPQPQAQVQSRPQPQAQEAGVQAGMAYAKKSHLGAKLLLVLIILIVLAGVAYFPLSQMGLFDGLFKIQVKNNENQNTNTSVGNVVQPNFAQYTLQSTKFTPSLPNYTVALDELGNLKNFETAQGSDFSQAQTSALTQDNFFITQNNDNFYNTNTDYAGRNDDWTALYKTIGGSYADYERQPENSVFVTSDFVLHVYHKLIDEEFSYIEEASLYPALDSLSKSMLSSSAQKYSQAQDQLQKDSYERLSAYFLVASAILDNASADYQTFKTQNYISDTQSDTKSAVLALADFLAASNNISDNAKNIAKAEINLIFEANNMAPSPLMGASQNNMLEDYTQFGPRSHYAKNVILRDYFRVMMFYGRMNFVLKSPELTRDAANITMLLTPDLLKQWESIYQPTTFFVGKADDLTPYEYSDASKKIGFTADDESDTAITKLQNELLNYRNPQIMSSVVVDLSVPDMTKEDLQNTTKGFRFMGQRFTPDAFVFSTLTQGDEAPDVKTGQSLPSMPTALMVSTLMGSQESANLLNVWIANNAPNSDKVIADRMQTLQDYFDQTTQQQWTQNIYWSWLYTIKSLFGNVNISGYPMFMKSEDWSKKTLQSFLGSWTELKHDTLLYAKQSYAEMGAGGPGETPPANPVPKGYVEPNVALFDRLISLVNLTNDGLKQFGILPANLEARNNTFKEALQFYRTTAVAELQNQKISDENFDKLRLSAGQLDGILQAPDSGLSLESNARSAIIADVHTDAASGQILYEADGIPNYVYVAVKDANGTRLTKGLVYSYYEFPEPLAKRLTDQDWQRINYSTSKKNLVMPWWNVDLVK